MCCTCAPISCTTGASGERSGQQRLGATSDDAIGRATRGGSDGIDPLSPDMPTISRATSHILFTIAMVLAALWLSAGVAQAGSTPPPYRGAAKALIPLAATIKFEGMSSPRAIAGGATATFDGVDARGIQQHGVVTVILSKTATAALASYQKRCPACERMIYPQGWRYKRSFTPTEDPAIFRTRAQTLAITGICSNVLVSVQLTAAKSKTSLSTWAAMIANGVFQKAGLSPCRAQQPVPTKKVYWTQSQAEDRVVATLKIPYCSVSNISGCERLPGVHPREATCSGADESGATFTYARFTCKIVITDYYGKPLAQGNVAVYPTGPTTFVWKLL